jgi:exodeoxyribonuclease V gamma subunit
VSLEAAYDAAIHERELRGQGPSGLFARGERANHLATLETWRDELAAHGVPLGAVEVHRFGRGGEHSKADAVHPPLWLDVDVVDGRGVARIVRVELTGRTMPMGPAGATSVALLARAREEKDDWGQADRERIALRAFVDHAVLSALGVAADRVHDALVVIATGDGTQCDRLPFGALSRDEATMWLRAVTRDLLAGPHAYFLPCEAILARQRAAPSSAIVDWLERARGRLGDADDRGSLRSAYGPVPRVREYAAPDESTARAMADRRFGLLFAKRGGAS